MVADIVADMKVDKVVDKKKERNKKKKWPTWSWTWWPTSKSNMVRELVTGFG